MHSGLQFGGEPIYSTSHEQTAIPFTSLHRLFSPHGDGRQTSITTGVTFSSGKLHDVNGSPVKPFRQMQVGT